MKVYSYSRLKQFLECARKFRYHYVDGFIPDYDGVALPMGKATHAAIEAMATGAGRAEARDAALQVLYEGAPSELGEKDEQDFRKAEHQLRAIVDRYPKWEDGIEIVAVEQEVTAPMPYGRGLKGILDLVVRVNGNYYVWDTKTTGDQLDKASATNRLRLQYPAYAILGEHLLSASTEVGTVPEVQEEEAGLPRHIHGVVVDLIHKPRVYVRKDGSLTPLTEKNGPQFHREPIRVDDTRRREFVAWFNHVTTLIELNEHGGIDQLEPGAWPMNDGACTKWGRMCPYAECCRNPERALQLLENSSKFKRDERLEDEHTS